MIDHLLGRPSMKSRRLQVLAVVAFWTAYLGRGNRHGPPVFRVFSRVFSKRLTAWQTVVLTMIYLYAARNFSTLVGLASPDPLTNMYESAYFRATWVLTAMDAGFWTAMKIRQKWLRDLASIAFSLYYLIAAEQADEKVRKVRGNITVDHMRVSWDKGSQSPYLRFFQNLMRPRFTRWPPRQVRIHRPAASDYKEPVSAWLYFDGPLSDMQNLDRVILDIPGGGFVAMNPRCNDDKLLAWAAKTRLPVLSLDYKKAPEYPYPYALNECYDVYTTLIETAGRCIGMSGKVIPKVVITGDSAGGTLATSTTLMIIESGSTPVRRFQGQMDLPVPAGLILFYPALDMNIGSWMSDEQMALIKDRRMRGTNKPIIERKTSQYNRLANTPHQSDDEDDSSPNPQPTSEGSSEQNTTTAAAAAHVRSPAPEYAHSGPTTYSNVHQAPPSPVLTTTVPSSTTTTTTPTPVSHPAASHHPEPMRTRLATSSMISYFNDRVLTPEMMRGMIILYVGPHNRPDFSQDYLLSPILAPDVLLSKFPKTYFLTGERDPLVDDTVVFAGRLRRVKAAQLASGGRRFEYRESDVRACGNGWDEKAVAEVVLIPGISHGFVQFPSIYPPAWGHISRAAGWVMGAFREAERRGEVGKWKWEWEWEWRERGAVGGGVAGTESSGEEDHGLEMMSMTKIRAKFAEEEGGEGSGAAAAVAEGEESGKRKGKAKRERGSGKEGSSSSSSSDDASGDSKAGRGSPGSRHHRKKSVRRTSRAKDDDDKTLVKLASTDDLLGRRMHGLAGG